MHPVEMDALLEGLGAGDFVKHEGSPVTWCEIHNEFAQWTHCIETGRVLRESEHQRSPFRLSNEKILHADLASARAKSWWKGWRP